MADTTPRQREVLRVIADYKRTAGHAPTIAELCLALDISSKNAVVDHLRALERRGLITKLPRLARTLSLTPAAKQLLGLAAALVLLAGCDTALDTRPSRHGEWCTNYCDRAGMSVAYLTGAECVCAPRAPACEAAWSRAEIGIELLTDCRAALAACSARGGR
jgi:DNA-binding MarR family transcriptional regulator